MINIALVSHSPHLHGSERSLLTLARLFNKEIDGINSILMLPVPENGEFATAAKNYNLDTIYTPPNPWYIYKSPYKAKEFYEFCNTIKKQIAEYICLFNKINANIVVNNTLTNFIPSVASYLLNIPIITWVHGVLDSGAIPGIDPNYQKFVDIEMCKLGNKVIYCSKWTEEYFKDYIPKEDTALIPNWTLEPSKFVPYYKGGKTFVCLNTMEIKKGIKVLIDAANILKDLGYDFKIDLYGSGPEYSNIVSQINKLGLNKYVTIKPRTVEVETVYDNCIALVQPSLYESFGRTIIEAMSHKRPVIAAYTADPEKNIKNNLSGFHVKQGNAKELAEKMIYILENPEKAEIMGEEGYKIFKMRLNGDIAKEKLIKLINQTINLKPTQSQELAFKSLNNIHKNIFNKFDGEKYGT